MSLEIIPIGGFGEIGRNCAALKVDDEILIFDMGLQMENYIAHTDTDDIVDMSPSTLIETESVPNIDKIDTSKVVGICISHAHLDHLGATVFLGNKFDCPIYGSPFTVEVLHKIIRDEKINFKNKIKKKKTNSRFRVSDNIEVEFINVTHSTPHTVLIAAHTKYGTVLYANDYKLDQHPTLGQKTNIKRLKKMDVKALIVDCLYSTTASKTPSEFVAKQILKEILLEEDTKGKNVFVTTFASHIARLNSIKKMGQKMGRKVVFMGRSLAKYTRAAENAKAAKFKDVQLVKYSSNIKSFLNNLDDTSKYLFVVTGHQGEPKAALSRIIDGNYFPFKHGDFIVFSCTTIPVPLAEKNREVLEKKLYSKNLRVFKDAHVSGHAFKEDQRDFFNIVKPKHIIPVHGDKPRMEAMKKLALEEGYSEEKIHLLTNKDDIRVE